MNKDHTTEEVRNIELTFVEKLVICNASTDCACKLILDRLGCDRKIAKLAVDLFIESLNDDAKQK